jgi:hypothetical protein
MKSKLLLSFLLGFALPAQEQEGTTVQTTLSQIRHEPEAFKNVQVELTVQFVSLGRIANPFFTKFTPTEYANFYVWGDEQPIWRQNAYEDVCGTLFLSKESDQLQQLYSLKLYQRLKVTAVVRNTFQNTPWIEVVSFSPLPAKLDTAVLTHLYRGEKLMAERQWQRAIAELQRVPGGNVPETALAAAYSNLGTCMLRIGEADKAMPFLQSASALTKGNDLQIETMLETAKSTPAKEIDRTVNVAAVQDSNRPMWEAFDTGKGVKAPQSGNPVAAPAR